MKVFMLLDSGSYQGRGVFDSAEKALKHTSVLDDEDYVLVKDKETGSTLDICYSCGTVSYHLVEVEMNTSD